MPDNQWGFLDDDDDGNDDIGGMDFDNFNSNFLDDDDDDDSSATNLDDGLFGDENTDLPSSPVTTDAQQASTPQDAPSSYDQQSVTSYDTSSYDQQDTTSYDDGDDDELAFGMVDPQDNLNSNRAQADLEDGVIATDEDDDGIVDFSQSVVDDGSSGDAYPQEDQSYTQGNDGYQQGDPNVGQVYDDQSQDGYNDDSNYIDDTPSTSGYDQPAYDQASGGYQSTSQAPVEPITQMNHQPIQQTNDTDGDQNMNMQSTSPQAPMGQQGNWGGAGGTSQPQTSRNNMYSSISDVMPKSLDLKTIGKIIKIVDDYRDLDQTQQSYVKGFLDAVYKMGKSSVPIDGTEASIIKSIIEIDPNIREGVMELSKTKSLSGSERAFHLMALHANQLQNMNVILLMMSLTQDELHVSNDLDSIREASIKLDGLLNQSFGPEQQNFIAPVLTIMQDVKKIMES